MNEPKATTTITSSVTEDEFGFSGPANSHYEDYIGVVVQPTQSTRLLMGTAEGWVDLTSDHKGFLDKSTRFCKRIVRNLSLIGTY